LRADRRVNLNDLTDHLSPLTRDPPNVAFCLCLKSESTEF
jgi:hypothetical protein